jgi:hypothetical protein
MRRGYASQALLMNAGVLLGRRCAGSGAAWAALVLGAAVPIAARADAPPSPPIAWRSLEPGLELGSVRSPIPSEAGDSKIRVLRIDPTRFELQLLNASASADGAPLTAKQWAERYGLVAAINASLYQADQRTSVSLMKSRTHTNNPRLSKHNAVLLFDRLDAGVPPVQIVDRTCRDLAAVQGRYGASVQSIRMVSCTRANVWTQQPENKFSTAAVGIDQQGRLLFIHVRSPLSTHDLIDSLLALPLGVREAMYVEGGPEAQLYVNAGGTEVELVGSRGSSFAGIENTYALPIPNVLGVRRLAPTAAAQ